MIILAYVGIGLAVTFALFAFAHRSNQKEKEALEEAKRRALEAKNNPSA